MEEEIILELNIEHRLRKKEDTVDDILYPDSRYYRKDKESHALYKNKRIYESIPKKQP